MTTGGEKNIRRALKARIQNHRITKSICRLWKSFIRQDLKALSI